MAGVGTTTNLAGWGANLRADCLLTEPTAVSEVAGVLDRRGTIARGLGRSYGDCAINANGQVIGTTGMDHLLAFDELTGILTCEGGTSLGSIIEIFAPRGWFPMITPGTKFVTIAGCIANDIHGKAHHAQGCFSSCVESMTALLGCCDRFFTLASPSPSMAASSRSDKSFAQRIQLSHAGTPKCSAEQREIWNR